MVIETSEEGSKALFETFLDTSYGLVERQNNGLDSTGMGVGSNVNSVFSTELDAGDVEIGDDVLDGVGVGSRGGGKGEDAEALVVRVEAANNLTVRVITPGAMGFVDDKADNLFGRADT